jgi:hypothetical protein
MQSSYIAKAGPTELPPNITVEIISIKPTRRALGSTFSTTNSTRITIV